MFFFCSADDPNNHRAYHILVSTVDDKFVELTNGMYATLGGDKARCRVMRKFSEHQMNNLRAKNLTPNVVDVCAVGNAFFQHYHWVPGINFPTRIMISGWNPSENRCNIFEVGDGLHCPELRTEAFFGFGSGYLNAAPMLQKWNTEYATMDANKAANILKDILLNITLSDPFTGGDLKVYSVAKDTRSYVYKTRLVNELNDPNYARVFFDKRTMLVIIEERDMHKFADVDLIVEIKVYGANPIGVFWIDYIHNFDRFLLYRVVLESPECCRKWFSGCQQFRRSVRRQLFIHRGFNLHVDSCMYYLGIAEKGLLDRALRMRTL
ncbi:hypothetical protein OROMI_011689 [Orobanche minor]